MGKKLQTKTFTTFNYMLNDKYGLKKINDKSGLKKIEW